MFNDLTLRSCTSADLTNHPRSSRSSAVVGLAPVPEGEMGRRQKPLPHAHFRHQMETQGKAAGQDQANVFRGARP